MQERFSKFHFFTFRISHFQIKSFLSVFTPTRSGLGVLCVSNPRVSSSRLRDEVGLLKRANRFACVFRIHHPNRHRTRHNRIGYRRSRIRIYKTHSPRIDQNKIITLIRAPIKTFRRNNPGRIGELGRHLQKRNSTCILSTRPRRVGCRHQS